MVPGVRSPLCKACRRSSLPGTAAAHARPETVAETIGVVVGSQGREGPWPNPMV